LYWYLTYWHHLIFNSYPLWITRVQLKDPSILIALEVNQLEWHIRLYLWEGDPQCAKEGFFLKKKSIIVNLNLQVAMHFKDKRGRTRLLKFKII